MGYRGAVQVASDDDSGPHRDFLIERKILAGRTYVLQVGTRTSSFTTVRITTNQIVAHGELASQSLQAVSTVEPARIGRLRDADWQTGTDFGTTVMGFGTVDRVFNIENFAVSSGTFSIDGVSISNRDDHFLYRYDTIPDSHQNSFRVSRLSNSRVRVQFNPQDAGVIEANLLIDYSMDGQSFQAQMPLVGRGSTSFASFRQVTLDGDAARMSSNFEYSLDTRTDRERYAWISLRFPEPATKVYIYIVPHGTVSSEINANFYRQGEYDRSPQLASIPGGFTYGFFDLTGDDRAGLKIDLPTTEERAISDFTVWVFAEG
jgi:hypothetical protein